MLKFILQRAIDSHKKQTQLTSFEKAKQFCLVINHSGLRMLEIKAFEQMLRNEGKAVECVYLYTDKRPKQEHDVKVGNQFIERQFYKNDFSFVGLPRTEELKVWLKEKYDYLIFCNPIGQVSNNAIAGLCAASCVIGCDPIDLKNIDLYIENITADQYIGSVLKTLKQIKQ